MQIQTSTDEIIGGAKVTAGALLTVTAANAEECFALLQLRKATMTGGNARGAVAGDASVVFLDEVARMGGTRLTSGVILAEMVTGDVFAHIETNQAGAISLTDNGGGIVTLSGATLFRGATAMPAGTVVPITIAIGAFSKTFNLIAGTFRRWFPATVLTDSLISNFQPLTDSRIGGAYLTGV